MKNFRTEIIVNGVKYSTLMDILPEKGKLEILFIAKTPAPISVDAGHYFQGKQGTMFWNKLNEYEILEVPYGKFADEYLLSNNYGITDIVKVPREFGNEPSKEEYIEGLNRILEIIKKYEPKIIVFVYKKVLDKILIYNFKISEKSKYGFNPKYEQLFNSKVFVFPMPGTPCTTYEAEISMNELKKERNKII